VPSWKKKKKKKKKKSMSWSIDEAKLIFGGKISLVVAAVQVALVCFCHGWLGTCTRHK
jgi:transposase-like protein